MYDRLQGVLPQPIGEGSHFRIPWLQSPNIMDIRTRPRTISSVTGTKGELLLRSVCCLLVIYCSMTSCILERQARC